MVLALEVGFKRFDLTWTPSADAASQQLHEIPRPGADVIVHPLAVDASEYVLEDVPLHLRWQATYAVQTCMPDGECISSELLDVAAHDTRGAVGYLKDDPSEPLSHHFGASLDLDAAGNTVAVGTRNDGEKFRAGSVVVYDKEDQEWSITQVLRPEKGVRSSLLFGDDVALSSDGDTLVVRDGAYGNQGAAHVYERSGSDDFVRVATFRGDAFDPSNVPPAYGDDVAISGDGRWVTVTHGCWRTDDRSGVLDVYHRDDSGEWGLYQRILNTPDGGEQVCPVEVAVDEEGARIVAAMDAVPADPEIRTWSRDSEGVWHELQDWRLDWTVTSGRSVTLSSDGTRMATNNGTPRVFVEGSAGWAEELAIHDPLPIEQWDIDPVRLSGDGSTLIVPASQESSNFAGVGGLSHRTLPGQVTAGAAFVFSRSGSTWTFASFVKQPHPDHRDSMGGGVAVDETGTVLALAARFEDSDARGFGGDQSDNSQDSAGAVYLY